ncbi:cob(I)yrinic acid a,c-diamide adenosyltransferase [Halomicroarcula sp. GCM10025324]|uniref:cob(I)yrinic acid a,c-diamide adenosyltransferase n=1 Tax=Haloarcula TaxID=2237 RepID=UPI0023E7BC83|nr:cob(I)yrinic acid a,c-diamide adenosyltransferase [Halomicroarcula sp. ZS-22-S1]
MSDDETGPARNAAGPTAEPITPSAPESFGLVQVWWGNGKGKTTAALGMATRAVGHGYRVHLLQFMKGGTGTVEDVRGEYNAIAALPGFSYENAGHYGWHGFMDGSDDDEHQARAEGALERAHEILAGSAAADLSEPLAADGPPEDGVNMLVVDEILYAANRGLVDPGDVVELVESKPEDLELVLTGGHEEPGYVVDHADLVTEVRKQKHPLDAGYPARKGTEY